MNKAEHKTAGNRLIYEKSPYLLQHAHNPVDWYPWGNEAFKKAKEEDKPIFLSIGYATCHWCHVMAHESFEDVDVARLLNDSYVGIKVDREERPDIDNIYMAACQAFTGRGGWPLSVFMTPDAKPFYAGTYFPKMGGMGLPGFMDILTKIAALWEKNRSNLIANSEKITDLISPKPGSGRSLASLGENSLKKGYEQLRNGFDPNNAGFGPAPKFPTPHQLTFLLRWHKRSAEPKALEMVEKTLEAMRRGGLFDQIGFGFHRYSVDPEWLVPHFEKMLYDQALLTMAYIEAFQATGKDLFAKTAKEIFTYVLRDMVSPEGGFYSAEDADSEGKEGLFYIWTAEEIKRLLGKDPGELVCRFYDVTEKGNFEDGFSIPHMPRSYQGFAEAEGISLSELETILVRARERLFDVRSQQIPPLKDDKILTSWNGLMIAALSKAYPVFGDRKYADAAKMAANFILKELKTVNGRLLRRYRQGDAAFAGYLEDYAFLVWGLIELYEATFEVAWLEEAVRLNQSMIDIYWDNKDAGLFYTGEGNEALITRSKEVYDGAIPSGNSVAALNLFRLGRLTGNVDLEHKAEQLMSAFSDQVASYPAGYTHLLSAVDFWIGPTKEIVITGDESIKAAQDLVKVIQDKFLPNKAILFKHSGTEGKRLASLAPFVEAMNPVNENPTAYVCEQYACKSPITDIRDLEKALQ